MKIVFHDYTSSEKVNHLVSLWLDGHEDIVKENIGQLTTLEAYMVLEDVRRTKRGDTDKLLDVIIG